MPKPKTTVPAPRDLDGKDNTILLDHIGQMYDVLRLAIESDSTRLITMFVNFATPPLRLPGVTVDTHNLTHHGGSPDALKQLETIERAGFEKLKSLIDGLHAAKEAGESLLDRTAVVFGTAMGDANTHSNTNLPVLVAGGGFKHAGHLAFDTKSNTPLANLFVTLLQKLGVETEKFASSTGTLRGLDLGR